MQPNNHKQPNNQTPKQPTKQPNTQTTNQELSLSTKSERVIVES
jgi:hypothetical protein